MRPYLASDPVLEAAFRPRFLGQAAPPVDGSQLLATLQQSEQKLAQVNAWMQARPQYLQILGGDAPTFQQTVSEAANFYPTVTAVEGQLQNQTGVANLTSAQYQTVLQWIQDVNTLANYAAQHSELTPGGAPTSVAVMPAAAGAAPSPWLVAGGAVVGVGILALIFRG